jgi:hydroxymethylglutaryl-CoA reductase (NADPH)
VAGTKVFLDLRFTTGDAAGQNMVTIASHAALAWILARCPVPPHAAFLESNLSGDKKANAKALRTVRGKKVVVEATLSRDMIERHLNTTPERMVELADIGTLASSMSGAIGAQAHCANGLAAMFLACGQDVACVSEAHIALTDFGLREDGALRACLTLPNLIVGTVGGGTGLPSQRAALAIMGLAGAGHARAFAEVAACLCLAGELSLIGAICAGEFAAAHSRLARGRDLAEGQ